MLQKSVYACCQPEAPDGQLVVRFKRPWADGTNELRLWPVELLARLAAIIPQRGRNQLHYHGVFAPCRFGCPGST